MPVGDQSVCVSVCLGLALVLRAVRVCVSVCVFLCVRPVKVPVLGAVCACVCVWWSLCALGRAVSVCVCVCCDTVLCVVFLAQAPFSKQFGPSDFTSSVMRSGESSDSSLSLEVAACTGPGQKPSSPLAKKQKREQKRWRRTSEYPMGSTCTEEIWAWPRYVLERLQNVG